MDIVTGSDGANAQWHEVKSLAFNTFRNGGNEKKAAYNNALGSLDLPTITNIKKQTKADDLAVLGEDSLDNLVVKSNQFYTKEFFVDRVYAGVDTANVTGKIRWVFQDFEKTDMNKFEARSGGKKGDIVVSKTEFLQCGINKLNCSRYISGKPQPLDDIRSKLVDGIRSDKRADVLDILIKTFNTNRMKDDQDAIAYLSAFSTLKKTVIVSENSKDWLAASVVDNVTGACGIE